MADPLFGSGPQGDPGYFASLRTGTVLAQLRRAFLGLSAAPIVVLALSPLIIRIETHTIDAPRLWACALVPLIALGALAVARRLPRQLAPQSDPVRLAGTASASFRAALFLRFALTEGVVLSGLPLSMAADSLLPMLLAFAMGYPMMLMLAVPTRTTIEAIRARLEAGGVHSELWAALMAPYEPTLTTGD